MSGPGGAPVEDGVSVQLAVAYYESARAEILHRIGQRDTALFLFLASAATIFGVAISEKDSVLLYVLPLLGLGAAHVHSNHSNIIGALGQYLAIEVQAWVGSASPTGPPVQWDASQSLRSLRSQPVIAVLTSGLMLILLPSAIGLVIAFAQHHGSAGYVLAAVVDAIAVLLTAYLLINSLRVRVRTNQKVGKYLDSLGGPAADR